MTTQAIITCVILVITMVLLISQKVPLVILGAAIPAALAATGVINAGSAYTEFGNTTIVFFMGLVVVGEAFFKTGLADFIENEVAGLLGARKNRREGHVELDAVVGERLAAGIGFLDAELGQVRITPAGKQVLQVPVALAMAHEHEGSAHIDFLRD